MEIYKKVYVIIPLDENGKAIGAYVGRTSDIYRRLRIHFYCKKDKGKQSELHELMRTNPYICLRIDTMKDINESHLEYDWIDFIGNVLGLKLFNDDLGYGDYRNISCIVKGVDKWKKSKSTTS